MKRDRPAVLILHRAPAEGAGAGEVWRESDAGVLEEAKNVAAALARRGFAHRTVGMGRLADVPGILSAAPE